MAFELIKNSVDKIIHPTEVEFSLLAMGILVASILVKIYMYFYNQQIFSSKGYLGPAAGAAGRAGICGTDRGNCKWL